MDTRVALGMERNSTEADFVLFHKKCLSHFWSAKIGFFFVKHLPKCEIKSWEKHTT
jgi:hypothetical protein